MLQSRGSKERGRRSRLFLLKIGQHGMLRLWNCAVRNTCGNLWYVSLGLLPALFFLLSSAALKACVSGPRRPGAKKRLVSCLAREQDHGNPPPISRIERKQNMLAMPLWFNDYLFFFLSRSALLSFFATLLQECQNAGQGQKRTKECGHPCQQVLSSQ